MPMEYKRKKKCYRNINIIFGDSVGHSSQKGSIDFLFKKFYKNVWKKNAFGLTLDP
jgi:hypothetical protein